ncbi:hypothetical protein [Pseudodesulfovibrio sediminis]|uniref:Terminase small subunit n=1 Tax=Pseudodesulfovibrio sediminis TaxID=2810563 RepID=A0ABN6EP08_9BACT|nr:hypothetical protein [Pseudodesulfovibrio sediminis]BCS86838.1 hypothetical protein PSDVSF_00800 [Pseudodesulfovibrio sediminis]
MTNNEEKKGPGRPTKMTEMTLKKLEEAFALGSTDVEACLYAEISHTTLSNYCNAHPEFLERKQTLKLNPVLKARKVVMDDLEKGDSSTAKWVLDKHEGKAKQKHEVSGNVGGDTTERAGLTPEMKAMLADIYSNSGGSSDEKWEKYKDELTK